MEKGHWGINAISKMNFKNQSMFKNKNILTRMNNPRYNVIQFLLYLALMCIMARSNQTELSLFRNSKIWVIGEGLNFKILNGQIVVKNLEDKFR